MVRAPEAAVLDAAARLLSRGAGLLGPGGEAGGTVAVPPALGLLGSGGSSTGGSAAVGAGQIWA